MGAVFANTPMQPTVNYALRQIGAENQETAKFFEDGAHLLDVLGINLTGPSKFPRRGLDLR